MRVPRQHHHHRQEAREGRGVSVGRLLCVYPILRTTYPFTQYYEAGWVQTCQYATENANW
ncbi:hypothetical protein E2C01_006225 [Portunus trituberculatus]|uniref:Uncharacterized protein n=1 Tax=Portunus trituberculatus TaxID=210409 RepID=A0A5B7CUJ4_PORTR|nr:hypothetical protein [Portunus trituberculatus]